MGKPEWEEVTNLGPMFTERLRVPGGWLYREITWDCQVDEPRSVALCFVPEARDDDA